MEVFTVLTGAASLRTEALEGFTGRKPRSLVVDAVVMSNASGKSERSFAGDHLSLEGQYAASLSFTATNTLNIFILD